MSTKLNLKCDQGSNFNIVLPIEDSENDPRDFEGYVGYGTFRSSYISTSGTNINVSLSTGSVSITLTSEDTENLKSGIYVYDIIAYDSINDVVARLFEGNFYLNPAVTKKPN